MPPRSTTPPQLAVLVGAGAVQQRGSAERAGDDAVEAVDLMAEAVLAAAGDATAGRSGEGAGLVERIDWIGVPEGTWSYRDPGRLLAARLPPLQGRDAASITTVVAEVGILQQDLFTAAAAAVADGARVALVVGGEAKHRALQATIAGRTAPETTDPDGAPDVRVRPDSLGVSDLEIVRNTVSPVAAYALIENARGHALGRTLDEHRRAVAAGWARLAAVAAQNPRAWDRSGYDADAIADAGAPGNRMISYPYTKRHSAQWNVDQAAALLFCTLETARDLGVSEDRIVFPVATTVANHAVPVSARRDIHRCIGAEVAASAVLELAGATIDDVEHVDLYSCFPVAVQVLAEALGLSYDAPARDLSVTGGLPFAGGPLNNYVLQALVELVGRLRADPGALGLSTSVSGFLVKQGFALWSSAPPAGGAQVRDLTDEVARRQETVPVGSDSGTGTIATWTVDVAGGAPVRSVAIVDLAHGGRTIATATEPAVAEQLLAADPIGADVVVRDDGTFRVA